MKKQFLHQGDVQMITSELPKNAKLIEKKPVALGGHSGHQHVITGEYDLYEVDGVMFAKILDGGAILQHIHKSNFTTFKEGEVITKADHKHIHLKPNTTYKIGIHKKYNPFAKVWEKVID